MKRDHCLTLYTKLTQNGLDLNIRPETIQLLEENIGGKLLDIGLGNSFVGSVSKSKGKAKI